MVYVFGDYLLCNTGFWFWILTELLFSHIFQVTNFDLSVSSSLVNRSHGVREVF